MSSKKILYVPCYPGELGWELINYIPHVNCVFSGGNYSEVHCVVREGREALYPMATRFYPISLSTKKSMGNNGPKVPSNNILNSLKSKSKNVDVIKVPGGGCKYIKHRKYLKYKASENALWKWRHIPQNSIIFCVRGRNFGTHKNWSSENWNCLAKHVLSKGFIPVISGLKELVAFELPAGCINVQDKTNFDDLLAIMQKSQFAIGGSTGPLHLASLANVAHAVWGSSRIKDRYLKSWNPHRTEVEYHICNSKGKGFNCPLKDALRLADKMIDKIYHENSV